MKTSSVDSYSFLVSSRCWRAEYRCGKAIFYEEHLQLQLNLSSFRQITSNSTVFISSFVFW